MHGIPIGNFLMAVSICRYINHLSVKTDGGNIVIVVNSKALYILDRMNFYYRSGTLKVSAFALQTFQTDIATLLERSENIWVRIANGGTSVNVKPEVFFIGV